MIFQGVGVVLVGVFNLGLTCCIWRISWGSAIVVVYVIDTEPAFCNLRFSCGFFWKLSLGLSADRTSFLGACEKNFIQKYKTKINKNANAKNA